MKRCATHRCADLVRAHVVDLTLTADELLAIARDENWSLGAAATYVQRGGFWSHYDSALTDCLPIFENVHAHEPDAVTPASSHTN